MAQSIESAKRARSLPRPFLHLSTVGDRFAAVLRQFRAAEAPLQQPSDAWTGGHFTDPYEQNTQQSPAFGRSNAPHPAHSWKNTQAFVGIVSAAEYPQCGQVTLDSSIKDGCIGIGAASHRREAVAAPGAAFHQR